MKKGVPDDAREQNQEDKVQEAFLSLEVGQSLDEPRKQRMSQDTKDQKGIKRHVVLGVMRKYSRKVSLLEDQSPPGDFSLAIGGRGEELLGQVCSCDCREVNDQAMRVVRTAFRKTAMRPCLIRLSLECFKGQAYIWPRGNWPRSALWLRSTETCGGSM